MDVSRKKPMFLHTIKAALLAVCLYSTTTFAENKMQRLVRHSYSSYPYLYFTNQTLYLSILTSVFGVLHRFAKRSRNGPGRTLLVLLNSMLPVALSLEAVTTGVFWSLYFYNKKLVIHPRYTEPGYETPILTELGKHLFPLILLLVEQIDVSLEKTICQPLLLVSYLMFYYALVTVFAMRIGKYPYSFLNTMNSEVSRASFFVGIVVAGYSVYFCYMRYKIGENRKNILC